MNEEKKENGGRGGRGRGRGRCRGRKAEEKLASTPEKKVPSKRPPVESQANTPERRELFPDPAAEPPVPEAASSSTKQPKKRAKAKAQGKAKAKAAPSQPAEPAQPEAEAGGSAPEPDDGKVAADGKMEPAQRLPGQRIQKPALKLLKESKADPAAWFHVQELHKALKFHKLTDKKEVPKYDFWSLSMYWQTKRVGLLQKQESGFVHVTSFGCTWCKNIAMCAHAARMFATWHASCLPLN